MIVPFTKGQVAWNKGKKMPFKHRKMADGFMPVRVFKKGHIPWNKGINLPFTVWNKGRKGKQKNHNTDGLKLGALASFKETGFSYIALHQWVRRKLGTPHLCTVCGITNGKFQWANKSGEYKRDLSDWIRLCIKCHRKYDGLVGDWRTRPSRIKRRFYGIPD